MIDIRSSFRSGRFGLRLLAPAVGAAAALALLVPSLAGAATQSDTTVANFAAGDASAGTYVSDIAGGEVILNPTVGEEFADASLPVGWSSHDWNAVTGEIGGAATVGGGSLQVNGAFAGTVDDFAPGRSLEFVATFGAAAFQHVGFAVDLNTDGNWAIFSTNNTTTQLFARTNVAGTPTDTPIGDPGEFFGTSHRYRIEWIAAGVNFFVDDMSTPVNVLPLPSPAVNMRPAASDLNVAAPGLSVDWLHMSPYPSPGTFDSRVFDAVQGSDWGALSWTADEPTGTGVALSVRTGNTTDPDDGSWSAFAPIASSGADVPASSRYLQYRAVLSTATADLDETPALNEVSIDYEPTPPPPPPAVVAPTPPAVAGAVAQKKNCKKIKNKQKRKKCKKKQRN